MKLSLSQANQLLNSLKTIEVKGHIGFNIARNIRLLQTELQEYESFKLEIFKKYGTEKDGVISVDKEGENYKDFMGEIMQLELQECDVSFYKFTEEELGNCEELTTSQQLFLLTNFLKESETESEE